MKLAWVNDILEEMAQHISKPIYFVLDNHDDGTSPEKQTLFAKI